MSDIGDDWADLKQTTPEEAPRKEDVRTADQRMRDILEAYDQFCLADNLHRGTHHEITKEKGFSFNLSLKPSGWYASLSVGSTTLFKLDHYASLDGVLQEAVKKMGELLNPLLATRKQRCEEELEAVNRMENALILLREGR